MRVLIVGGGTAGWMTAAALSRLLPRRVADISLIESDAIGTVGVGEATVPHIRFFNRRLGFDETEFMARTRATFKLGIEFCDWARIGDSYIHPFGDFGRNLGDVAFHQHWTRMSRNRLCGRLEEYSLPVRAARNNRFIHPPDPAAGAGHGYSYAYQFDAGLYGAYLRSKAELWGVKRTEGSITRVQRNGQTGFVDSVVLDNGAQIEADLFIDCSGFRGLLINQTMGIEFDDWQHWLPCDRAWAVPCETSGPLSPYTRASAHTAGWFWRIPLQHRVGNGHVFSSAHCPEERARNDLIKQLESPPTGDPKLLRFTAGKRKKQWAGNVVAIGLASGFLEPLESTSIHLIQLAIGYLIDLFPGPDFDPVNEREFNRVMSLEYKRIRDFLILHYHATERDDSDFWNDCRTLSIPDSLAYRIELFRERGLVPNYREGMFLDASWIAVSVGQGIRPAGYDPRSERTAQEVLVSELNALREEHARQVAGMPAHDTYLARIGALHAPAKE